VANVLNVLLAHQREDELARLLEYWRGIEATNPVLVAYGGSRADYERVTHMPKLFIDDPRLRTRDHQREYQSITAVLKAVRQWMRDSASDSEYIHLAEYDHLPLVPDLNERQVERISAERADILGFHLHRIDGTSHPHYLYHTADRRFHDWLRSVSVREDKAVTLSMLGTGSFWTREAFDAVAMCDESFPIYFELYLPTLAHHLGFRLRDMGEQNRFVVNLGDRGAEISSAVTAGAWSLHPVKRLPAGVALAR
jgi:hypothetical protein